MVMDVGMVMGKVADMLLVGSRLGPRLQATSMVPGREHSRKPRTQSQAANTVAGPEHDRRSQAGSQAASMVVDRKHGHRP